MMEPESRSSAGMPAVRMLAAILLAVPACARADVIDLFVHDGSLIAGGAFARMDDVQVSNVALWNGSQWNPLGKGLTGGDVQVLRAHAGRLVAGGSFTATGSEPVSGIAMWDGAAWSPLGGGVDGTVRAITTFGTDLIAGGSFSTAGGVAAANIARWDGTSWHALGGGVRGASSPGVDALALFAGELYATGGFDSAGAVAARNIARWDGTHWSPVGTGLHDPFSRAPGSDLEPYGGALVASGCFTDAGGVPAHHAARWDGISWAEMGFHFPAYCAGLEIAVLADSLYASGFLPHPDLGVSSIVRWDGITWGAFAPAPQNRWIVALAWFQGRLVVGGQFTEAGGLPAEGVACWDGREWHPLRSAAGCGPVGVRPQTWGDVKRVYRR